MKRCQVIVLGAGMSGICMAIKLKEAGIEDFLVLEKTEAVGGTWHDNTYPGACCDVASHLYSFSFAQKPDWSRAYASRAAALTSASTPPSIAPGLTRAPGSGF